MHIMSVVSFGPHGSHPPAMVTLVSGDHHNFVTPLEAAQMSVVAKGIIEETGTHEPVRFDNVKASVLARVLEYCKFHTQEDSVISDEDFDKEFMSVDLSIIFDIIEAANYLDIPPLLDLATTAVAVMIKGKTAQEIRDLFRVKGVPMTAEDKKLTLEENKWAFQ
jgi:S-phase kinase-associated protein 1